MVEMLPIFFSGVAAAVAVLHGLLFLFFPRRTRGNLYYALFAIFLAGFFLALWQVNRQQAPEIHVLWQQILGSCGLLMSLFGLRFELCAFEHERSRSLFYPLTVVVLVVIAWFWLQPKALEQVFLNVLGFVLCAEMLRIVLIAMWRRRPDAWVVGLGFASLTLGGLYATANNMGWVSGWIDPYALPSGIAVLTVSMSAYLARDAAQTQKELEQRLEEVRTLDSRILEQDRKAHDADVERARLEEARRLQAAELEEARRLQLSMLPSGRPELPNVEVAFRMWTASEVGGDYYDFQQTRQDAVTLALGDATGHGLNSGLMVASTKSLFQTRDEAASLPETLGRISRGIKAMNLQRMNVAMMLARIEGRRVFLSAAGMPPALIYRCDSGKVEEVMLPGPPLGTMVGFSYREHELALAPGDCLLLMTDGLPELLNPEGLPLGYEETSSLFRQVAAEAAEQILDSLFDAAAGFAAGQVQEDDLTLVVLKAT